MQFIGSDRGQQYGVSVEAPGGGERQRCAASKSQSDSSQTHMQSFLGHMVDMTPKMG